MDLANFITIISILIAVYALLPRAIKLTLFLKVIWVDKLLLSIFLIGVHYILFFEMFKRNDLVPDTLIFKYPFTKNELAYWLLLMFLFLSYFRFTVFPIPKRKIYQLHKLVEELLPNIANHPQLINLLGNNLQRIEEVCVGKGWLSGFRKRGRAKNYGLNLIVQRLSSIENSKIVKIVEPSLNFPLLRKDNIPYFKKIVRLILDRPEDHEESIYPLLKEKNVQAIIGNIKDTLAPVLMYLFSEDDHYKSKACTLLKVSLLNKRLVRSIAALNPYFSLKIYQLDMSISHSFSDRYLVALLEDVDSILYMELKSSQNLDVHDDYNIPESNRLLYYLLDDVRNAETFGVWKPIGDLVIADLEKRKLEPESDEYNYPLQEDEDRGYWGSKVYVGIRFFDLMIRKAILQNITWHMWLYYFDYFVDRICENFKSTYIEENYFSEWPTRYAFLLHEIFYSLKKWIFLIENIDLRQENLRLSIDDNGNPVKSSIIVMSSCLFRVAHCKEMPDRMKRDFFEMALDLYLRLKESAPTKAYAKYLFRMLLEGGRFNRVDDVYYACLLSAFVYQDNIPYNHENVMEAMTKITRIHIANWGVESLTEYLDVEVRDNVVVLRARELPYRYTIEL